MCVYRYGYVLKLKNIFFAFFVLISDLGFCDCAIYATVMDSLVANSTNGTAPASLPSSSGGDTLRILTDAITIIFFVMGLGYFSSLSGFVPRNANKGIGPMVGKICLPLLIFRNVAKLDLTTVNFGIVGCCFLVKVVSLFCASLVALKDYKSETSKPGDFAQQVGIYTLFVTGSNDLAMGLAIIESLYPASSTPGIDLGSMTFVIVAMQVAIFNPIHFALLELGKSLRELHDKKLKDGIGDSTKPAPIKKCDIAKSVLLNLLRSPVLVSTFLGLIYNAINPPSSGDMSSNRNIPALLDAMMAKGGSAFGMSALFLGGMAVVGKFGMLRGKKLVIPLILSLIKVLVAPVTGYYLATVVFAGDPNISLFSEYIFVYSSLPTAGSIIVFSQAFNVSAKDMISGASVLVLLLFVPVMFTTTSLLVGGDVATAGIANTGHILSIVGSLILIISTAISPDWRTYPKYVLLQVAITGMLFSFAHLNCQFGASMGPEGWAIQQDRSAAVWTFFFRMWHRLLVTYGLGLNFLLIYVKGKDVGRRLFPYTSVLILIGSVSTTVVFATTHDFEMTRYPCWYNYGPSQIEYDMVLLVIELVFLLVVLGVVNNAGPKTVSPRESANDQDAVENKSSIDLSSGEPIVIERIGEGSELEHLLHNDRKCGITGGFMFRTNLYLGVVTLSTIAQILSNRTALHSNEGGIIAKDHASTIDDPILAFIQVLTMMIVNGHGLIFCFAFVSMRTNGWFRMFMTCRTRCRELTYGIEKDMGIKFPRASNDTSEIHLTLRLLANKIADMPDLFRDRKFRFKVYKNCVPGNVLLDRLLEEKMVETRDQGLHLMEELQHAGLLHHVTYEHSFKDASFFYCMIHASTGNVLVEGQDVVGKSDGVVEVENVFGREIELQVEGEGGRKN